MSHWANAYDTSASVTFANVAMAKTNHITKPKFKPRELTKNLIPGCVLHWKPQM